MKTIILMTLSVVFAQFSFTQNNEVRVYSELGSAELISNEDLDGLASNDISKNKVFGIKYLRSITEKLSMQTGLGFIHAEVKRNLICIDAPCPKVNEPCFKNYSWCKCER